MNDHSGNIVEYCSVSTNRTTAVIVGTADKGRFIAACADQQSDRKGKIIKYNKMHTHAGGEKGMEEGTQAQLGI